MKRSIALMLSLSPQTTLPPPPLRNTAAAAAAVAAAASCAPTMPLSIEKNNSKTKKRLPVNTKHPPTTSVLGKRKSQTEEGLIQKNQKESTFVAAADTDAVIRGDSSSSSSPSLQHPGLAALERDEKKKVTPFQKRVLTALCRVPPGYVTTYKLLGQEINCPSGQAVGQALRRNPYAPLVPCHRVVAHDLTLGGFGGQTDGAKLQEKVQLLQTEGVVVLEESSSSSSSSLTTGQGVTTKTTRTKPTTRTGTTKIKSKEKEEDTKPQKPSQLRVSQHCLYEFKEDKN